MSEPAPTPSAIDWSKIWAPIACLLLLVVSIFSILTYATEHKAEKIESCVLRYGGGGLSSGSISSITADNECKSLASTHF